MAILLLAAPHVAEAQPAGKVPRVGYLSASSPAVEGARRKAFSEGLRELGWIEGQNILIEERGAVGQYAKLPDLAAELVKLKPDVIVAAGDTAVIKPLRAATSAIPIVMTIGVEPEAHGFISSVRRPGGNITGMAWTPDPAIAAKYLQLLKEMIAGLRRVGVLVDRAQNVAVYRNVQEQAAAKRGLSCACGSSGRRAGWGRDGLGTGRRGGGARVRRALMLPSLRD
jgi:putative tryptophan/tyrosine transport system substrate-binding protein